MKDSPLICYSTNWTSSSPTPRYWGYMKAMSTVFCTGRAGFPDRVPPGRSENLAVHPTDVCSRTISGFRIQVKKIQSLQSIGFFRARKFAGAINAVFELLMGAMFWLTMLHGALGAGSLRSHLAIFGAFALPVFLPMFHRALRFDRVFWVPGSAMWPRRSLVESSSRSWNRARDQGFRAQSIRCIG